MKIDIIYFTLQIPDQGKFLFLRYSWKGFQPIRLQDSLISYFLWNDWVSSIFYMYTHQKCAFFAFSENFIIRFSGNEFPQDCSGHYSVKYHVWQKFSLLRYGSKNYWPITFHDFCECNFSLTTWLFGIIVIVEQRPSG